jgi:acyl carrier protein
MTLTELVADVLQDTPANITEATSRKSNRRWDSFNHVQLIVRVEDEYGVKFTNAEIDEIVSVTDLRTALRNKGVTNG